MATQSRASMSVWTVLKVSGTLLAMAAFSATGLTMGFGFQFPNVLLYVSPLLGLAVLVPILYGTLHWLGKGASGRGEVKRPYDY